MTEFVTDILTGSGHVATVPSLPKERLSVSNINLTTSAVTTTLTGTTSKTLMASYLIPSGVMGPNSTLIIEPCFTYTGSTNLKTMEVAIGPSVGNLLFSWSRARNSASQVAEVPLIQLINRGTQGSQIYPTSSASTYATALTTTPGTYSIDFLIDNYVYVFGTLVSAAESIVLQSMMITVRNPGK